VLLVEAYSPLAKPLMLVLAEEGFVVHLARDDEQASTLAHAARYVAFLVDWNVPRNGGLALVRRWRQEGLAVPVLLLDSSASNERLVQARQAGADDCLAVPFCIEDLLARLRAWAGSGTATSPATGRTVRREPVEDVTRGSSPSPRR